jgi:hypothetical protein
MPLKVVDAGGVDSQSRSRLLRAVVVAHGGARVGVSGGDLHVAQVDAGVEHGGDEGVPEHVWVHPGDPHAPDVGEMSETKSGSVAVHPHPSLVQDTVSVFLAEVGDVSAGGFEDPQAEQPEHGDQGEVVGVG